MTVFPRVTVLDGAPRADRLREMVASRGYALAPVGDSDVVVLGAAAELPSNVLDRVRAGTGLVALTGASGVTSDSLRELLDEAGIALTSTDTGATVAVPDETAAVTDLDLLARVTAATALDRRPDRHLARRTAAAPGQQRAYRRCARRGRVRGRPGPRRRVGGRPRRRSFRERAPVQRRHLRRRAPSSSPGIRSVGHHRRRRLAPSQGRRHRPAGPAGQGRLCAGAG